MSATLQENPSFARARSELYDLLSAVFDGDVAVIQRALDDDTFVHIAETLPTDITTEKLRDRNLDAEGLKVGYDNLFAVPGAHYVPPFASAHVDDPTESFESDSAYHDAGTAGELYGDPAETVSEWYLRADFEPDRGDGIPDHLAAEFEFMAALTAVEASALESSSPLQATEVRATQRELLDHLTWLEPFAEAVAENDSNEGFYAAIAAFAHAFVTWDRTQLHA